MRKKAIRDRLFEVTSDFKESQTDKPLPSLKQWDYEPADLQEYGIHDKREHPRKDVSIYGIFETTDSQFRTSTKNVSIGGVLIDPEKDLFSHEYINMFFFHRKFNVPVQTNGKIVRVGSDGVGIQFNKVIPAMSSL
jgi:hypothetical protein